ncbi:MAG: hypothetical protein ABIS29_12475 [Vicinamibacterales bacterium]
MRVITTVLVATFLLAGQARAQNPAAYVIPGALAPRDPLPRFTVAPRGGTLAPIGLPLPRIGLQPPPRASDPGHYHRDGVFFLWPMTMLFYVPQPVDAPAPPPAPLPRPVENVPAPGRLILHVQPAGAQVFADGYYVGVPEDFSAERGGGLLEAGPHRIDVNATGFEPLTLDLRVSAGQPVTIRAALKPLPPPVAVPPTTFYLIPGCYMGNIPPKDARLPATCDQSRIITWLP